jgi:quinol monooxygenase YgiN
MNLNIFIAYLILTNRHIFNKVPIEHFRQHYTYKRGTYMIQVIATIELNPDCLDKFLPILHENVPKVKAEEGCLAYEPSVDVDSGLPVQGDIRQNTVTLVEAWVDLDALHAHLNTPHMAAYREAVKDFVQEVRLQVLKPV